MSRKRPTQIELERENSELKRRVQKLEKRLKQALRHLKDQDDLEIDNQIALDLEAEESFRDMLAGKSATQECESRFIVVTLPNGTTKRIPKRICNE